MALLLGVGLGAWQYRSNVHLGRKLEVSQAETRRLEARVSELEAALVQGSAAMTSSAIVTAAPAAEDPPPVAPGAITRQYAYVAKITESAGRYTWTLDYAQWLVGAEAAAAAAARGEESPPPNDYFVVNDNPKLRSFPVDKEAKVTVYFGDPSSGTLLSVSQYHDVWLNDTDGNGRNTGFWVNMLAGKIVGAEEQWIP